MLFQRKTAISFPSYDPERQQAVLKCSICTGEQVAGFLDRQTGHFTDVMLIRNEKDLRGVIKSIISYPVFLKYIRSKGG